MGKLNIINRTALRYLNKGVNLLDFQRSKDEIRKEIAT